jgi:hypothetical protein
VQSQSNEPTLTKDSTTNGPFKSFYLFELHKIWARISLTTKFFVGFIHVLSYSYNGQATFQYLFDYIY